MTFLDQRRGAAYLYAPMLAAAVIDIGLTIHGNLPYILATDRALHGPREISPLGRLMLEQAPSVMALSVLAYLAVIYAALWLLPHRARLMFSFAIVIGHGFAGFSWFSGLVANSFGSRFPTAMWTLEHAATTLFGSLCAWSVWRYYAARGKV